MEKEDKGHTALINDIGLLFMEAQGYNFHDFKNTKYAAPKMSLIAILGTLQENVKQGFYDD